MKVEIKEILLQLALNVAIYHNAGAAVFSLNIETKL
jgi:hypothetical protein